MSLYSIDKLMTEARRLAAEYRRATGRTLPITQEIATNDAVRLLELQRAPADAIGFHAVRLHATGELRVQVKGRVIFDTQKGGQRLGQLTFEQPWDITLLVLLDDDYEPFEIYEADRETLLAESIGDGGQRRGTVSVAKFKMIGMLVWTREEGVSVARI